MVAIATVCIHKVDKLGGTPDNHIDGDDVMFLIDDQDEPSLFPLPFFLPFVTPDIIGTPLLLLPVVMILLYCCRDKYGCCCL